jgi:HlyD family secretion protein
MNRSRLLIGAIAVLILAALGYAGYRSYLAPGPATPGFTPSSSGPETPTIVSAEGKIIPLQNATLAFRMAGRIQKVVVKEGDTVQAGAALIQLEADDLQAAVDQAEAAVALAKAQLDQVKAGARPEEIAAAEAAYKAAQSGVGQAVAQRNQITNPATADTVAAAEAQLAQAQAQQKELQIAYDRIIENIKFLAGPTEEQARFKLNAANQAVAAAQAALDQVKLGASQQTIQAYNSAVGVAAFQRDATKAQLELLKAGASKTQIAAAQAQLDEAKAMLDAAKAQLAQATLRAPFSGTIVSVPVEVGEVVAPSVPALILADLSHWRMQTNDLSETDVVLVSVGQKVTISLDAFVGQTFSGTVAEIASVSETNRGNVTYAVTIDLDPTTDPLRWGMTAFADIQVDTPSEP